MKTYSSKTPLLVQSVSKRLWVYKYGLEWTRKRYRETKAVFNGKKG